MMDNYIPDVKSVVDYFIVDTTIIGGNYYENYLKKLWIDYPEIFTPESIYQIYTESWSQIFEGMEYELVVFHSNLAQKPNFDLFINNNFFKLNPAIVDEIRVGFIETALAIYFKLVKELQLLRTYDFLHVQQIAKDFLVIGRHSYIVDK